MPEMTLPQFSKITIDSIEATLKQITEHNLQSIDEIVATALQQQPSWQNCVAPIEALDDHLSQFWSPISHLNSVKNNPQLRDAYNACLPILADYATNIGQNEKLYQAIKTLKESPKYDRMEPAQQKILRDNLRDFKLSGIGLAKDKQTRYKELTQKLSKLSATFEENVMDCANAWHKQIEDQAMLAGIPERAQDVMQEAAKAKDKSGWLLTLDFPCYHAVMTYANDRELRKEMYTAYSTRASDQGPHDKKFDNSGIMNDILKYRHEKAGLVDFDSYAEYSLATKMADKPEEVLTFLHELVAKTKPQAQAEYQALQQFAKEQLQFTDCQSWDMAYISEKMRQHLFDLTQEQLRPYFPIDKVLQGFFQLLEKLFGITMKPVQSFDRWHDDVMLFEIHDLQDNIRGHVYLDLYAREKKRGGAWMDDCRIRRRLDDGAIQLPIAFVTCNFSPASGNKPATLDHEEVLTLFHEFGHALHHLLTKIDYADASGINGVAWDAVEFPSQFMEHWCWTRETLDMITGHVDTGETLPQDLFEKMLAAKNFQSGLAMLRQLEFALFDFRIHHEYQANQPDHIAKILAEVRDEVAVIPVPAFNRFAHSFSHIFAGGYAAGYYSYKWAEVLACDAYSRFEEEGLFNHDVGTSFLQNILEKGGSEEPKVLFKAFRGREPELAPLLKYSGIDISDMGDVR